MRSMIAGSRSGSPLCFETKTAIGTPQARWRLTHQSGRDADHAADAVAAGAGHEIRLGDGLERPLADAVLAVEGDEPLRRGAEDHRLLGAPGMRVAVRELALGDERAHRLAGGVDGLVRLEHVQARRSQAPAR